MNGRLEEHTHVTVRVNDYKKLRKMAQHTQELESERADWELGHKQLQKRVEELESRNKELIDGINSNNEEYGKIIMKNKRYRETIKEIKNEAEWMIELSEHGHKFESIKNRCDEVLEGDE